ncbi:MAG: acetylglutamate kinase [Candidatus Omnitrophica bacterium]|nr:acetylglutamate kinase [Candidatus Omnitrophota bacterium]
MPSTRHNRIPDAVIRKASILLEALPYLQSFRGKTFVIKYGGSALADPAKRRALLQDVVFLSVSGIRPVLVHGGGAEISRKMSRKGKTPRFVHGLRVTDAETLKMVAAALATVNRLLVKELKSLGARAQGLIGSEARIIRAEPYVIQGEDLGFVGKVTGVNPGPVQRLLVLGVIPVVMPLGSGWDHQTYNINADEAASALAAALKAEKFVLVTDVPGILREPGNRRSLIPTLTRKEAGRLIKKKVIAGGMIPKTRACLNALKGGVRKTHIVDISVPHSLLLEIFTDLGIGTQIIK